MGKAAILFSDPNLFIKHLIYCWHNKLIPVLLNNKNTISELLDQLAFIKPDILFTEFEIPFENKKKLSSKELSLPFELPEKLKKKETAVIFFTSGSENNPKAVVHTWESLINSSKIQNEVLDQKPGETWLLSIPPYHIGGLSIIIRALVYKLKIIFVNKYSDKEITDTIIKYKINYLSLVSTQLYRLINNKVLAGKDLKWCLLGGGFIEDNLIISAQSLGWKILKVYGSSETSAFISVLNCTNTNELNSVGQPLHGVEIKIIDNEVAIKSPTLFKEYLFNKIETEKVLISGYYLTGDIGYLDKNSNLHILGRRNDIIVSGGENINVKDLESRIKNLPQVLDVKVLGLADKEWGSIPVAAIVLKDKTKEISLHDININSSFRKIKKVVFIDKLPRTELGKIKVQELRKLFK